MDRVILRQEKRERERINLMLKIVFYLATLVMRMPSIKSETNTHRWIEVISYASKEEEKNPATTVDLR